MTIPILPFATLGADPKSPHAMKSLEQGAACLPDGKKPLGAFICQGKVDPKLIEAMYRMFPSDNIHGKNPKNEARHKAASTHPDEKDLSDAAHFAHEIQLMVEEGRKMTVKDLAAYIAALPEEERILQFGKKAADPLQGAFRHKRVVHAGLKGRMIPPDKAQARWNALMERPVEGNPLQMAYLHIPFCKTKCLYCGFFQNGTDMSVEDRYVDHLLMELAQDADKPRLQSAPIQSVFIGGGTPTSLSPSNIRRLLRAIRKTLPLANDYELTLEGRVHDLVEEKMDVWMEEGVNRISLGVQSFDTKVRQQVGRIDTGEEVMKRLQKLSAYNQCAVIIDLMYGLPDQTLDVWQEDLHHLVESGVDGADLYQLDVFENSDLHKRIEEGRLSPAATTLMQTEMFRIGRRYMAQWGCKRISHCHWAKNNRERSLYNTLARSRTHLFPFGCGAGGHVDGVSTMLHRVLGPYEGMVARE